MNEKDLEDALKRLNQLRMLHLAQCREDVQRIIDNKNTDENYRRKFRLCRSNRRQCGLSPHPYEEREVRI